MGRRAYAEAGTWGVSEETLGPRKDIPPPCPKIKREVRKTLRREKGTRFSQETPKPDEEIADRTLRKEDEEVSGLRTTQSNYSGRNPKFYKKRLSP